MLQIVGIRKQYSDSHRGFQVRKTNNQKLIIRVVTTKLIQNIQHPGKKTQRDDFTRSGGLEGSHKSVGKDQSTCWFVNASLKEYHYNMLSTRGRLFDVPYCKYPRHPQRQVPNRIWNLAEFITSGRITKNIFQISFLVVWFLTIHHPETPLGVLYTPHKLQTMCVRIEPGIKSNTRTNTGIWVPFRLRTFS